MAKKKKRKEEVKTNNFIELYGILLIVIAIIGTCKFGIVGKYLTGFAAFLFGEIYIVLFAILFAVGLYIMMKREKPNFLTSKLIGLYIILAAVLVLIHFPYDSYKGFEIVEKTFGNLCNYIKDPKTNLFGGGMTGALLFTLLTVLLDKQGTLVISWFLIISGLTLFTGKSIYDVIKWLQNKANNAKEKLSVKDKVAISKVEDDYENDQNVLTITSLDELDKIKEPVKTEEVKVETPQSVQTEDETYEEKIYFKPPITLLNKPAKNNNKENETAIEQNIPIIQTVLGDFGIIGKVVAAHVGPSVTQYELEIKHGTKVSKVTGVNKELALALAAKDIRIQAPIPGKSTIGIELPNKKNSMVSVREILERMPSSLDNSKLAVTLGKDIMGNPQYCEINKTPHLLVAGSTGSGKSVCINSFIISILMRSKPDEVKLILVDPKKVELSMYNGVPHLLAPVVTDPQKANIALKKMVVEMERRYDEFEKSGTKNIAGYNAYVDKKNENLPQSEHLKKMPYIVIIIDELADLMLVAAKEVQDSIMRITQMARAAGMHLIVATQRPSTDVITGVVKANIPSRIAFAVSSGIDSRTILDSQGAEKLLGKGDMLFLPQGENTPIRIQGTFISDEEIKTVVDYTIKQQKAHYDETLTMSDEELGATTMTDDDGNSYDGSDDPYYDKVKEFAIINGKISTSLVQRRFKIGYNRAANIIDKLFERGIIGPQNGSKPREVLVKLEEKDE
ncbi:MAG: DNA translocase FtsK 4TM domain-containing protein [Bacilli bacterium]|nr:DNA translocase FtsK 4TM domain-containing protein [Bacilli bacterium]